MVSFRRGRGVHGDNVRALQQLRIANGLNAILGNDQFLDVRVVGQHVHAKGPGTHRGGPGYVTKGDKTKRLPHEAWKLRQQWPTFAPTPFTDESVHSSEAPERGEEEHHSMIGDFFDKRVRHIRDWNVARRS